MLTALSKAEPQIRALARAIGWERRQVVEALQAHASIEAAEHVPVAPPQRWPFALASVVARAVVPVPKFSYVRSKVLMAAYRKIECQHCGKNDGTVCGAHSNWAIHGKGRSIKASDIYCASLCTECHAELDQGPKWSETERKFIWWRAHCATVTRLLWLRLWPHGTIRPNVIDWPKEWD